MLKQECLDGTEQCPPGKARSRRQPRGAMDNLRICAEPVDAAVETLRERRIDEITQSLGDIIVVTQNRAFAQAGTAILIGRLRKPILHRGIVLPPFLAASALRLLTFFIATHTNNRLHPHATVGAEQQRSDCGEDEEPPHALSVLSRERCQQPQPQLTIIQPNIPTGDEQARSHAAASLLENVGKIGGIVSRFNCRVVGLARVFRILRV